MGGGNSPGLKCYGCLGGAVLKFLIFLIGCFTLHIIFDFFNGIIVVLQCL